MAHVGRYAKLTAKPGQGDTVAGKLLEVAQMLRETPGCELYVINRSIGEPDVIWVTELWQSQDALDESLQSTATGESIQEVRDLLAEGGFERIDVEPLGGVGFPVGFEAGPEGLEFLAMGTHHAGDVQMRPGFWPA
jgi:quinol monooxygenase YgiN